MLKTNTGGKTTISFFEFNPEKNQRKTVDLSLQKELISLKKKLNMKRKWQKIVDCFGVDYGNFTSKLVTLKYNLYKQTLS